MARPGGLDCALLTLVVAAALLWWRIESAQIEPPRADALRYLDYSTNLLEYGVFGLGGARAAPPPGRANTPLYPAFIAAVLRAGATPVEQLRCYLKRHGECSRAPLATVLNVQLVIAGIAILLIATAAWMLLGRAGAWLAAAAALASGQPTEFAGQLLTENFSILLFATLTVLLLLARDRRLRWLFLVGLNLGALSLNRPEFIYLAYAFILAAGAGAALGKHWTISWRHVGVMTLGVVLVCGPWMWRNVAQFGDIALTESYGGRVLAQRVRYNQMSNTELAVAFVYWLPDFGDSLAQRLFPPAYYEKLHFGPGTYYSTGDRYHDAVAARTGGEAGVTRSLLLDDVLAHPFKHAAVTAALAWRAVFVGKLWGLGALVAFVVVCLRRPPLRRTLLGISAPAWFMLAFYAAVSVSIPRYAICFLPVFSLAWAALFVPRSGTL